MIRKLPRHCLGGFVVFQEKFYRTEVVFEDKNFQFLSSKTTSVLKTLFVKVDYTNYAMLRQFAFREIFGHEYPPSVSRRF